MFAFTSFSYLCLDIPAMQDMSNNMNDNRVQPQCSIRESPDQRQVKRRLSLENTVITKRRKGKLI